MSSDSKTLQERDAAVIWHPYTQMYRYPKALPISHGLGATLFREDGSTLIDAISSWWVTLHGHAHPYIVKQIALQAEKLEQVIFAGFTHEPAVRLAERLLAILPNNQKRVFFSDDGSTAVEVALKIAIQAAHNRGEQKRNKIVAFEGGYHGDTFGAMSVGSAGFALSFAPYLFKVVTVPPPLPGQEEVSFQAMKSVLSQDEVLAFIYEPLVQGSRGMRMYSPEALSTILSLAKKGGVTCIADEVMTGFGRTGRLFASLAASPSPDLMCFSKGLTGGFLPLGITTATEDLFGAFLSQEKQKALLHGHSFTANPIACAAANASLDLLLAPQTEARIKSLADWTKAFATRLGGDARVSNPRSCGTIVAFEVGRGDQGDYFTSDLRDRLYHYYIERGVLLRPLGNTVYVLPPLCITDEELKEVESAIIGSLSLIGEQLS